MKNRLRQLSCLCLGLLLAIAPIAGSAEDDQQSAKPAVVVSVASVDNLLKDVGYLTKAIGSPQLGTIIAFSAGDFIHGLDTTRPAGALLSVGASGQPSAVIFVPVADFEVVTSNIEDRANVDLEDLGGGVKQLTAQRKIYLKEHDGWMFASDQLANLNELPENPVDDLQGLEKKYDIAVQINLQSIPVELRDMAISEIEEGFTRGLAATRSDNEQRELQEQFGGRAIDDIVQFMKEAEQVTVGWGIDRENRKTYIDFAVTAVAGSDLAHEVAAYAELNTTFAGFMLPDAAATFHFAAPIPEEDIEYSQLVLGVAREKAMQEIDKDDNLKNDQARQLAKEIVGSLLDVADDTLAGGKLNGAAALVLEPKKANFIAGGLVADGKAVEQNLQRLFELASQDPKNTAEFKFNAEQHAGVSFHKLTVPVPDDESEARKVLGEELVMIVGTGAKSIYLAFGDESLGMLKQAIDASGAAVNDSLLPVSLHVALTPIMTFAASVDDDPVVAALAETLANGEFGDGISLTGTPIDRGVVYRVEVEEGVLQSIGQATKLNSAQNRDPF